MTFRTKYFLIALASLTLSVTACNKTPAEPPKPVVDSIAVKANTAPTEFTVGDTFSVTGGKLVVTYSDTTTKEVNMTLDMIPTKPDMTAEHLNYTVNVVYETKQTSYVINVKNPVVTVTSIAVKANTAPTEFKVGDTFSVNGGKLDVRYSNNTRAEIDMTLAMIKNAPDMSQAHADYEVQVEYEGARTTYTIQVTQGDTRAEVTIGVAYAYNGNAAVDIEDFTQTLTFYEGKDYKFYYGTDPSAAKDSIGFKFFTRGENPQDLGTEYPTAIGQYEYHVYIAEGDSDYKPAEKVVKFDIKAVEYAQFTLNKDNVTELGAEAGTATQTINGIKVDYKNAKAAENAVATLVKQAEADVNPNFEDNYIDFSTPFAPHSSGLEVKVSGLNNYVLLFASYDGENYNLIDTFTRAKSVSVRANDYVYFRLVGAPRGHQEVTIENISFKYEIDGVQPELIARAEKSDLINRAEPLEEGAFWNTNEMVYDANLSSKSLKVVNNANVTDGYTYIDFGFTIPAVEASSYKFSFKAVTSEGASYKEARTDETATPKCPVYYNIANKTDRVRTVGTQKKVELQYETEWQSFEFNLSSVFTDEKAVDISGIQIWITRFVTDGAVYWDDFRLTQLDTKPGNNKLFSITLSDIQTVEFNKNATFVFDGKVTALYSDSSTVVIANDDPNLTITAPDMTTSGTKQVTVSYTDNGTTKKAKYSIEVIASGDPKDEEILPIVAEADDLAKAANKIKSNSSYDVNTIEEETTLVYGKTSQSSIKASNLWKRNDTGGHVSLRLPSKITANKIHVKFFVHSLSYVLDVELMDEAQTKNLIKTGTTDQSSSRKMTPTDAGNSWMMYEHTFDTTAAVEKGGIFLIKFKCATASATQFANDFFYIDGLEVYAVTE